MRVLHNRITDSLQYFRKNHSTTSPLLRVLFNLQKPGLSEAIRDMEFFDETLNDSQKEAVLHCLRSNEMGIVHGPPGTCPPFADAFDLQ